MEKKTLNPEAFYPVPIELEGLRAGEANHRDIGEGVKVVVVPFGAKLSVFRDICPHMGGPLGEGLCHTGDRTLECPWHGYRFDLESGELRENPNERIMAPLRAPSACFRPDKAPEYRLVPLEHVLVDGKLHVRRGGKRG